MTAPCHDVQLELSVAHDQGRVPTPAVAEHLKSCPVCTAFLADLSRLDDLLARGRTDRAPAFEPLPRRNNGSWLWAAAAALVGVMVGIVMAGPGRLDTIQARELDGRLHTASPAVSGVQAELVVVERGWHPEVPERVYGGTLVYSAPEQLVIDLVDTTTYPEESWIHNDVLVEISNGDTRSIATTPCPVEGLPGCLEPPTETVRQNLRPFDDSVLAPLQIVGPTGFARWNGLEVIATPRLDDRPTIQVETTVAGADVIAAVTDQGAWRRLHPTDRVVMWLDEETLVPVRVEVFAADSPDRELWEVRHGYNDEGENPILVISLTGLTEGPAPVGVELPSEAPSGGFTDSTSEVPEPDMPPGFTPHRSGHRPLPGDGRIEVATWSDGRSWLMVETTESWSESRLFGMNGPFARRVRLHPDSIGYLSPDGDTLSLHSDGLDVVVSGSVPETLLVEAAASLDVTGREVPGDWAEAAVVTADRLPAGALVPEVEGWSILGFVAGERIEILLTGSGSRTVHAISRPGESLDPPVGADVTAVEVRGRPGRFDAASGTVEWLEDGLIYTLQSDTVGRQELIELAGQMSPR